MAPLARAGIAAGAHGIIVEVHDRPHEAKCDGAQALQPKDLAELARALERIASACSDQDRVSEPGASRPAALAPAAKWPACRCGTTIG